MQKPGARVAVVDDDASVRKAIARLLSACSFDIDTYGSAREFMQGGLPEGLQRPRKGPYDKAVGRNEAATQVPGDGGADDELGFPPDDESKWG